MSLLAEYLECRGITQAAFARSVGLTQATVSKLCRGKVGVSLAKAAQIERATGGAVPMSSFLSPSEAARSPDLCEAEGSLPAEEGGDGVARNQAAE